MNAHALAVLEFSRVLDLGAQRAASALGADRVPEPIAHEADRSHAVPAIRATPGNASAAPSQTHIAPRCGGCREATCHWLMP